MRFDSSSKPPIAGPWRWIVWAMTLVPALLVLSWSLRRADTPRTDPVLVGRSSDESRRLQRILNEPPADNPAPLRDDAVHVVPESEISDFKSQISNPNTSLLATINDNTFGVPNSERAAYEHLLAQARESRQTELENAARKDVSFAVLMLNAEHYRGELLTVIGDVRRLRRLPASSVESIALESYEAWLFTPDSGRHPYRIILTSLPEGIALADELNPPLRASATGFFFKRFSYATANNFHTAPLLLAKTLILRSKPAGKTAAVRPNRSRMLTIAAFCVVAFFGLVWFTIEAGNRLIRGHSNRQLPDESFSASAVFVSADDQQQSYAQNNGGDQAECSDDRNSTDQRRRFETE